MYLTHQTETRNVQVLSHLPQNRLVTSEKLL